MRITSGTVKPPKLVHGRFSNRSWLEDHSGNRITPKFKLKEERRTDSFVWYKTSIGNFVCHAMQSEIIYSDDMPRVDIKIFKADEHLYELYYYTCSSHTILFTQYGKKITDEYSRINKLRNGLIAAEKADKWGYIDGDANVVIPFIYKSVENFNDDGYAIVECTEDKRTVIDKKGNQLFEPIDCYRLQFITANLLKVNASKAGVGVVDLTGKVIIPFVYSDLWEKSGFILVKYYNKYGLLTKDGEIEFECMYPEVIETPDKFVVQDFARQEIPKNKEVKKQQ